MKSLGILAAFLCLPLTLGCQGASTDAAAPTGDAFTSNEGGGLEFTFDSVVVSDTDTLTRDAIFGQLEYLQGMLTTDVGGNAQFGHAKISNKVEKTEGDKKRVAFRAAVPVIWPKGVPVPTQYPIALPLDARTFSDFNETYDGRCGKNEYGVETFWHDFNPKASGCTLEDGHVSRAMASVRPHPRASEGKYLEYDRVWEDDRLDVMGVFGVISSSFDDADQSVLESNILLAAVERGLTDAKREDLTPSPLIRSVLRATRLTGKKLIDGKARTISLTTMIVQGVWSATADFDALYKPATETADYVYFSGHSELSKNIQSLAKRASVKAGKYQIAYLNGCQSFGYLGTAWNDKKRAANGFWLDPDGTRDLDVFATGLPALPDNGKSALAILDALEDWGHPKTVNEILEAFPAKHLTVVFGDDDNKFRPR